MCAQHLSNTLHTPACKQGKDAGCCAQDCWSARDEDAIAEARQSSKSSRKASLMGPKRSGLVLTGAIRFTLLRLWTFKQPP